jgi:hypothetical protein
MAQSRDHIRLDSLRPEIFALPIAAHRRARLVTPTLLVIAAAAVALAFRRQPDSSAPAPLARPFAAACPLSFAQQLKSVKAFAEMLPVFRHPRCRNCHGGLDVLSERHPGADQLDRESDPRALMSPEQRDRVSNEQCMTCHDNIRRLNDPSGRGGWMIPPPPMFFVNEDGSDKSDDELCRQMKRMEPSGEKFVSHIRDDHETIQFIETGFAGDRALGEGLKDYGLEAEPPPGTQASLTEKAKKWVEAVGEGYSSSPECGCVKPNVELEMKSDLQGIAQGKTMSAHVTATVKLAPDSAGLSYHGTAPLVHGTYTMPPLPPGCRVAFAPAGGDLDVKDVRFEIPDEGAMTIQLLVQPTNSGGFMTLTCPKIPPTNMPVLPFAQEWRFVHEPDRADLYYRFDQFDVPDGPAGSERTLVGSKDVTRTVERQGTTVTATTRLELWSVPPE